MSKYIETLKEKRQNALNEITMLYVDDHTKSVSENIDYYSNIARLKGEVEAYDDAIATYENLKNKGEI